MRPWEERERMCVNQKHSGEDRVPLPLLLQPPDNRSCNEVISPDSVGILVVDRPLPHTCLLARLQLLH